MSEETPVVPVEVPVVEPVVVEPVVVAEPVVEEQNEVEHFPFNADIQ